MARIVRSIEPQGGPHSTSRRAEHVERIAGWRKPILIVHIIVSVSLLGASFVLVALGIAGVRGADPAMVYPAAHLVERFVVGPLVILALVSGVFLARLSGWGLLRHAWVTAKLLTTAAFALIVFAVLIPRISETAALATTAAETFGTAERAPLAIAPVVAVIALALNVTLAVYKPRWTVPARSQLAGFEPETGRNSDETGIENQGHQR